MQTTKCGAKPLRDQNVLGVDSYDPDNLLDAVIERMNTKNDAGLARALEVAPPVISKIRNRRLTVGATMMIRIHDKAGMQIDEIHQLMGVAA